MVYLKWLALQADAFRGHGLSLEAQDGQMQTLRQDVANLVCLTRKNCSLQGLRRTGCTSTVIPPGGFVHFLRFIFHFTQYLGHNLVSYIHLFNRTTFIIANKKEKKQSCFSPYKNCPIR